MIREIAAEGEFRNSVSIIRAAFQTVADDFGITKDNCPTNPAFITLDRLKELEKTNVKCFGLFEDGSQIGFIGVEYAEDDVYYLKRLAVLPAERHKGHGKELVEFICEHAVERGGKIISVGIMDNHGLLKNWYKEIGFSEVGVKSFPHLPFPVCYLEKDLRATHPKNATPAE